MCSDHTVKSNCIWSDESCFVKVCIQDMYVLLHAQEEKKFPLFTKEKINTTYAKEVQYILKNSFRHDLQKEKVL